MENQRTIERDILLWISNGEVGLSSKSMAARMLEIKEDHPRHPLDPADLRRCLEFLDAVPAAKDRIRDMSDVSPQWFRLVTAWETIVGTFRLEVELDTGRAPKTYELMKAVLE